MIRGRGVTHVLTNSPHVHLLSAAPTPSSCNLHKVQEVGRKTLQPQASSETPHRWVGEEFLGFCIFPSCCMCEEAAYHDALRLLTGCRAFHHHCTVVCWGGTTLTSAPHPLSLCPSDGSRSQEPGLHRHSRPPALHCG